MDQLLLDLLDYQARQGLSDLAMAREIGISPSTWNRIKRGQRGMGNRVLQLVLRRFPELGLTFLSAICANSTIYRAKRKDLAHDDCFSTPSAISLPFSVTGTGAREIDFGRREEHKHGTPPEVDEADDR